jgi:hypothetical protein
MDMKRYLSATPLLDFNHPLFSKLVQDGCRDFVSVGVEVKTDR